MIRLEELSHSLPRVIPLVMIVRDEFGNPPPGVPLADRNESTQHSSLIDRTNRSMPAFAFGARRGVRTTRIPASFNRRLMSWLHLPLRTDRHATRTRVGRRLCRLHLPHEGVVGMRRLVVRMATETPTSSPGRTPVSRRKECVSPHDFLTIPFRR